MHVGLDGLPLTWALTGVGHYTLELSRALAVMAPADEFEFVTYRPLTDVAVREIEVHCPPNLFATRARRYQKWWAIGLPGYVRKARLDLFHGTNYEVPLWNKRRNVLTIHDLSILFHPDKHKRDFAGRARRRLPVMIRSASAIIAPTEQVKKEICENLTVDPNYVFVTPEAPRAAFRRLPDPETLEAKRRLGIEDDFILFAGTIEPRKNLLTLLSAFDEILRKTSYRPQLVIAGGEGWLTREWSSFISKSNLGDRLRLTGYLTDEDLCALYSSCRVFVYPSVYEGFGLPPLEAMACGAPVIASDISVFHETLGDAACFFDANDAKALAQSIVNTFEDEPRRHQYAAAGQARARRFSWETTARLTLEVYHRLLDHNRKSRGK